jgi:hypothetical protein
MSTTAEVKAALNGISTMIAGSARMREQAKVQLLAARNQLASLPTQYTDEIATINAFAPAGAFETLTKDEKGKLQAEFVALKSAIEAELTALKVSYS